MRVKSISNNLHDLPESLQKFAWGQDDHGIVDLAPGKEYTVYGTRHDNQGLYYWVLTDKINTKLPWWMPSKFFKVVDDTRPPDWIKMSWGNDGKESVCANPLFDEFSEDIEDGTKAGYMAFEEIRKEAEKDHT